MLRVKNLTHHYGSFRAVDNVSFQLPKGEIIGLLGHNGAGKTTIMKIISGSIEADSGTVEVGGVPLTGNEKDIQKNLGYLPESLPVYPEMTVADYLEYCAELKGIDGPEKDSEIRRVVKATNLESKFLSLIVSLSRGYKQRVGVAQAILGKPMILILDEPTNGLDPEQTQSMRNLIREIAKDATVILSTHIMQEVEALCSHVLILRSGQLVVDSALSELKSSNEINVDCSIEPEKTSMFKDIAGISEVTHVHSKDNIHSYRICFDNECEPAEISHSLAEKCLSDSNKLYRLAPVEADLEKLFFDVNYNEEVK